MFRMRKDRLQIAVVLLMLSVLVGACATSPIGKAVQTAHVQKQLVEASAVEFAKLYLQGKMPDDTYLKGKAAYIKWERGEVALAKSLADWKRLGDAESSNRLSLAFQLSGSLFRSYVDAVGQWVDLNALKAKLGGS